MLEETMRVQKLMIKMMFKRSTNNPINLSQISSFLPRERLFMVKTIDIVFKMWPQTDENGWQDGGDGKFETVYIGITIF